MTANDWKEFAKEKPKFGEFILTLNRDGEIARFLYQPEINHLKWTHWQPWADPPKTDPFNEWWEAQSTPRDDDYAREIARKYWTARAYWARRHPEDK